MHKDDAKQPSLAPFGTEALAATLTVSRERKKSGPAWQYHPRSDHHSKVACLLMALDLLIASEVLRADVFAGRVACGINHVMTDHTSKRKKAFDLVFHRSARQETETPRQTFRGLLSLYGVVLTPDQRAVVNQLPDIPVRNVAANAVYIAFEAKACMTEFGKARPRLFDELNSSHPTIHGDTEMAIAAGYVLINAAPTFVSPLRSPSGPNSGDRVISYHRQPADFESVVAKVRELPLRSYSDGVGFDAIGIVAVDCRNDGSPVQLVDAPTILKDYDYDSMITRVAHLYESRFHRV